MSRLSPGQLVVGIGGIALLISLFLGWASGTVQTVVGTGSASSSAFDLFSGMDIVMLVVALAAIAVAAAGATGTAVPRGAVMIVALLGVVVFGWALGWDLEFSNAGLGAWLALVASLAIAFGGYDATRHLATARRQRAASPAAPAGPSESADASRD